MNARFLYLLCLCPLLTMFFSSCSIFAVDAQTDNEVRFVANSADPGTQEPLFSKTKVRHWSIPKKLGSLDEALDLGRPDIVLVGNCNSSDSLPLPCKDGEITAEMTPEVYRHLDLFWADNLRLRSFANKRKTNAQEQYESNIAVFRRSQMLEEKLSKVEISIDGVRRQITQSEIRLIVKELNDLAEKVLEVIV